MITINVFLYALENNFNHQCLSGTYQHISTAILDGLYHASLHKPSPYIKGSQIFGTLDIIPDSSSLELFRKIFVSIAILDPLPITTWTQTEPRDE